MNGAGSVNFLYPLMTEIQANLDTLMGRQCQLRSHRAHINPGPYLQE